MSQHKPQTDVLIFSVTPISKYAQYFKHAGVIFGCVSKRYTLPPTLDVNSTHQFAISDVKLRNFFCEI